MSIDWYKINTTSLSPNQEMSGDLCQYSVNIIERYVPSNHAKHRTSTKRTDKPHTAFNQLKEKKSNEERT